MNKKLLILILSLNCVHSFAQKKSFDIKNGGFQKDTVIKEYFVFDCFRQEYDSIVYNVGCVFLMPSDSISFNKKNEYMIKVLNSEDGYIEVYFKNRLLYKYMLINHANQGLKN